MLESIQSFHTRYHHPNILDSPILKKLFKHAKPNNWKILEKDMVDEFIFRTENPRDRLILELMARGGMRVSEVLKITPNDVDDRKISDLEAMRWIDKDTQNRSFYIGEERCV